MSRPKYRSPRAHYRLSLQLVSDSYCLGTSRLCWCLHCGLRVLRWHRFAFRLLLLGFRDSIRHRVVQLLLQRLVRGQQIRKAVRCMLGLENFARDVLVGFDQLDDLQQPCEIRQVMSAMRFPTTLIGALLESSFSMSLSRWLLKSGSMLGTPFFWSFTAAPMKRTAEHRAAYWPALVSSCVLIHGSAHISRCYAL